jgi:hypothetical protein
MCVSGVSAIVCSSFTQSSLFKTCPHIRPRSNASGRHTECLWKRIKTGPANIIPFQMILFEEGSVDSRALAKRQRSFEPRPACVRVRACV